MVPNQPELCVRFDYDLHSRFGLIGNGMIEEKEGTSFFVFTDSLWILVFFLSIVPNAIESKVKLIVSVQGKVDDCCCASCFFFAENVLQ
jgi:hypothetical protein